MIADATHQPWWQPQRVWQLAERLAARLGFLWEHLGEPTPDDYGATMEFLILMTVANQRQAETRWVRVRSSEFHPIGAVVRGVIKADRAERALRGEPGQPVAEGGLHLFDWSGGLLAPGTALKDVPLGRVVFAIIEPDEAPIIAAIRAMGPTRNDPQLLAYLRPPTAAAEILQSSR